MFTARNKGRLAIGAVAVGVALTLSGCASGDPLDDGASGDADSGTIVVGSQAYPSNELIAEIYSQALEGADFTVERKFNIGQRDAYLPALESGEVQLFPEYTGNLLQFYKPDTEATKSDEVYAELKESLPANLTVLDQSTATDQDSYNVTQAYATANNLTSLADLKNIADTPTLGGNAELEERPYGPTGLKDVYGATVKFDATGDTTFDALIAGKVDIANVYTADPRIQTEKLVTLEDPEGIFLASNVVPLVNKDIADDIADVINAVDAKLTPEGLIDLNVKYSVDQGTLEDVASTWLSENGLS